MLNVALIGCGAIGSVVARAIDKGKAGNTRLVVVFDRNRHKAEKLAKSLKNKPKIANSFDEILNNIDLNLVVEAASQEAVRSYVPQLLKSGKDVLVLSVGALSDTSLLEKLCNTAEKTGRKIYIPSGAVAGIDGVKSAAIGEIEQVVLTTRKPPAALQDAPYVKSRNISLSSLKEPLLIYEGPASEACKLFPANVNIAATLSLAGIGVERTIVRIIADPLIDRNIHEIEVVGEFGKLKVQISNIPMEENPRTSKIAAFSAIATLKKLSECILVGT